MSNVIRLTCAYMYARMTYARHGHTRAYVRMSVSLYYIGFLLALLLFRTCNICGLVYFEK